MPELHRGLFYDDHYRGTGTGNLRADARRFGSNRRCGPPAQSQAKVAGYENASGRVGKSGPFLCGIRFDDLDMLGSWNLSCALTRADMLCNSDRSAQEARPVWRYFVCQVQAQKRGKTAPFRSDDWIRRWQQCWKSSFLRGPSALLPTVMRVLPTIAFGHPYEIAYSPGLRRPLMSFRRSARLVDKTDATDLGIVGVPSKRQR